MRHFPAKILVATDGSEDAAVARLAAVDLAVGSGSELHVVHTFEFIPPREYMAVALRLRSPGGFSRHGQQVLDEQVALIEKEGGVVSSARLEMGSPVDRILSASEEIGAGLVIVGRRGLGGVKRLLMGSVSEGLIHNTRCPVLVIRSEEGVWPPSRVIMSDDSSEDAGKSAELAASIGSLFDARGTLVQVYPQFLETSRGAEDTDSRIIEQVLEQAEAELRRRAESLRDVLGDAPDVKLVADKGAEGIDSIALTLIETAEACGEPTLISVGSRGLGRIQRSRVGSVSTKVVRAATGPVLVHPHSRD